MPEVPSFLAKTENVAYRIATKVFEYRKVIYTAIVLAGVVKFAASVSPVLAQAVDLCEYLSCIISPDGGYLTITGDGSTLTDMSQLQISTGQTNCDARFMDEAVNSGGPFSVNMSIVNNQVGICQTNLSVRDFASAIDAATTIKGDNISDMNLPVEPPVPEQPESVNAIDNILAVGKLIVVSGCAGVFVFAVAGALRGLRKQRIKKSAPARPVASRSRQSGMIFEGKMPVENGDYDMGRGFTGTVPYGDGLSHAIGTPRDGDAFQKIFSGKGGPMRPNGLAGLDLSSETGGDLCQAILRITQDGSIWKGTIDYERPDGVGGTFGLVAGRQDGARGIKDVLNIAKIKGFVLKK